MSSSIHDACETEIISESPSCIISRCKCCNTYHLHIGPISLRLKEDMFKSISDTILHAQLLLLQDNEEKFVSHLSH